ncbi:MAG TPA: serine/threonine-protein kinase, partial [Myxococcota bacterium]|nr:serine/threonine-protein kinase [Myxococcota bacterium]
MGHADDGARSEDLLAGRYRLIERIGQGGMAVVWRARDERQRVERAVKILNVRGTVNRVRAERLLREAQAMSRLKHRHVVSVYDHAESEAGPFVVMDYIPGGTLDDRLRSDGPLPARQAVLWIADVLSALDHAHAHGVVHRDVKPSNILVDATGAAMLADFGIALLEDDDRHTRAGVSMGSMAFMAPEQRIDARAVGPAADIYAAAATLFHVITGSTPVDLFVAEATSPRWLDLPEPLRPALFAATRHDPAARPQTAGELRRDLLALVDQLDDAPAGVARVVDSGTSAEPLRPPVGFLSTMDPGTREAGRRLPAWALALALVGGGGLWWWFE